MRSSKVAAFALLSGVALACGGGGTASSPAAPPSAGPNVLPLTVNGALCSSGSYLNKPCVSATVCAPAGSPCQRIDDLLLDTGSTGLRIFKQVLTVPLSQVTPGTGSLAECTQYADGTSQWGPVEAASVVLGNEPPVAAPIQVIDGSFGTPPPACANLQTSPAEAGFNGVLGVGPFAQDCGPACVKASDTGIYFTCTGAACAGTTVPLSAQVQNPVALLPVDGNGLAVQLPSVPAEGAVAVDGYLVLGIGTRVNNAAHGVETYGLDAVGQFTTTFRGQSVAGFLDTGSNGLFFGSPATTSLPACAPPDAQWYCPGSAVTLTATNTSATGSASGAVTLQIGNFGALSASSNSVFPDVGGAGDGTFDWGLPFHLGRTVFVGFEGQTSSLGTGPYFAY